MMNYELVDAGRFAPGINHGRRGRYGMDSGSGRKGFGCAHGARLNGNDGKESRMNKVMEGLWFAVMVPVVLLVWAYLWVAWMVTPGGDEV